MACATPANFEQEGDEMITEEKINQLLPLTFDTSDLPLGGRAAGKVRDWYSLAGQRRLIVTTDRLSSFDRILASVPYKGQVLNQLAAWWFEKTADIIPNHILSIPDPNAAEVLEVEPFLVEVVVRGYITGVTSTALWHRYSVGERKIYGYTFGPGLKKNQQLPEPIITPTTKGGPSGHDERLTCAEVVEKGYLNQGDWAQIQKAALAVFKRGQHLALNAGMILVDTKYEFGRTADGRIMLIDEVHTPDSSRFWKADTYTKHFMAGEEPENFDKEFIRLYFAERGYTGEGEPPAAEPELWVEACQRYIQIYELLTGKPFVPGEYPVNARILHALRWKGLIA
jgi:phosphoribosylaminoimidazole-succinocarboxamide synthase